MIRRPPRSTPRYSSAASDVYKRHGRRSVYIVCGRETDQPERHRKRIHTVSYTHLRAHETSPDLICRILLDKKNNKDSRHDRSNSITKTLTYPMATLYHYSSNHNSHNDLPTHLLKHNTINNDY